MIRSLCLVAFALTCLSGPAMAQTKDPVRVYTFGNSLINYVSDTPDTNVPVWLARMAQADERAFGLDGQWGFLRNFVADLPPRANWGFPGVRGAWDPDRIPFAEAGFTSILINPANFVQYQPVDRPYDGPGDGVASPLSATLDLFEWTAANAPGARHYIYEGWADMAGVTNYPPSRRGLKRYHSFNQGEYHDWYVDYLQRVKSAQPDLDVQLIPVARVMSMLLEDSPLDDIPAKALYSDGSPHGTDTLYLLAAMITYAALFEAPPPQIDLTDAVHPALRDNYAAASARIWEEIGPTLTKRQAALPEAAQQPVVAEAQAPAEPAAAAAAAPQKLAQALVATDDDIPALAMGLNGIADWSTQHPFIDLMKTARTWTGHLPGRWGGYSIEELMATGLLDPDGWPRGIPDGLVKLETYILTEQPLGATHLRGRYVLTYEGQGDLEIGGRAKRITYGDKEIRFFFEPGDGPVSIGIKRTDPEDYIRNIRVVRQDHLDLDAAGVLFNPEWIARIKDLRAVRFMDWMQTNGSVVRRWDDRPRMSDYTYTAWGVPLEVLVALANQIGADPWFTLPHMADDTYVRNFAETVRDTLDPRLKAYVEYSNEVWNFIFPQAVWARQQSEALWGEQEAGWMQFYGHRAAQVMDIWSDVFGAEADERLVRVVATHTGWFGLESSILLAPLSVADTRKFPRDSFDAYAITGYFGYELGGEELSDRVNSILNNAEDDARSEGEKQGLRRVSLREYVNENRYAAAFAPVAALLTEGSLAELTNEVFPYHAEVAARNDLRLVMYEGGTHVTGHGAQVNDDRLTEFFTRFNYQPEMSEMYETLLAGWTAAGGTLFNAFVDVAKPTQWGSWGALRHLNDENGRWDALMAFNEAAPSGWEPRAPSDFTDGVFLRGTDAAEALLGTAEKDILLAGAGDDLLEARGGSDHLHGGPGIDTVVLPGNRDGYTVSGSATLAEVTFGRDKILLRDVERVRFADTGEVRLSDLLGR